jgi:ATP-dependent Clp protease ATP-binding subunit ClpX
MYELPSMEGVAKVVIDEGVITEETQPIFIYEGGEQQQAATDH